MNHLAAFVKLDLLHKYIQLVIREEGINYLSHIQATDNFTQEEIDLLEKLSAEEDAHILNKS